MTQYTKSIFNAFKKLARSLRSFFKAISHWLNKRILILKVYSKRRSGDRLLCAAKHNDIALVKKLLKEHKVDVHSERMNIFLVLIAYPRDLSYEFLTTLSEHDKYALLELLVQYNSLEAQDKKNLSRTEMTAIDIGNAIKENNMAILKLYLPPFNMDKEARFTLCEKVFKSKSHDNHSFLYYAMKNKNHNLVQLLLDKEMKYSYTQEEIAEIAAYKKEFKTLLYHPLSTTHICFAKPISDIVADYLVPDYAPTPEPPYYPRPPRRIHTLG